MSLSAAGVSYREARLAELAAFTAFLRRRVERKAGSTEPLHPLARAWRAASKLRNETFASCPPSDAIPVDHELTELDNELHAAACDQAIEAGQLTAFAQKLDALVTQPEPAWSVS